MRSQKSFLLILFLLVPFLNGCGDTPKSVFTEAVVMRGEVADLMLLVNDEGTAAEIMDDKMLKLQDRWDDLKKRSEKVFKNPKKGDTTKFLEGFIKTVDEAVETDFRIILQLRRLDEIRYQLLREGMDKEEWEVLSAIGKREKAKEAFPSLTALMNTPARFNMKEIWRRNPCITAAGKRKLGTKEVTVAGIGGVVPAIVEKGIPVQGSTIKIPIEELQY